MASKANGTVMVAAGGMTPQSWALKAKELLKKARAQLLGAVVNGVNCKKAKDLYLYIPNKVGVIHLAKIKLQYSVNS